MKSRYGFTSQSKKAMVQEINRQILDQKEKFFESVDAMILWTLHNELGFGKKRIERFYKAVIRNYKDMCKYYEVDDTYPAEYKLREIGVDLSQLRKESSYD